MQITIPDSLLEQVKVPLEGTEEAMSEHIAEKEAVMEMIGFVASKPAMLRMAGEDESEKLARILERIPEAEAKLAEMRSDVENFRSFMNLLYPERLETHEGQNVPGDLWASLAN